MIKRRIIPKNKASTLSAHSIQTNEFRLMSMSEVDDILPLIRRFTAQAVAELKPIQQKLNNMVPADPRNKQVKAAYYHVLSLWSGKVQRLGLKVHGIWQIGFDNGQGWISWQYPERRARYFLEYDGAFSTAKLIDQTDQLDQMPDSVFP